MNVHSWPWRLSIWDLKSLKSLLNSVWKVILGLVQGQATSTSKWRFQREITVKTSNIKIINFNKIIKTLKSLTFYVRSKKKKTVVITLWRPSNCHFCGQRIFVVSQCGQTRTLKNNLTFWGHYILDDDLYGVFWSCPQGKIKKWRNFKVTNWTLYFMASYHIIWAQYS